MRAKLCKAKNLLIKMDLAIELTKGDSNVREETILALQDFHSQTISTQAKKGE
jgi:hypothetical protein